MNYLKLNNHFSLFLPQIIKRPMKKEYMRPQSAVIQLRGEQSLLTGSLLVLGSFYSDAPVPEALEGNTDSWGDWAF